LIIYGHGQNIDMEDIDHIWTWSEHRHEDIDHIWTWSEHRHEDIDHI